MNPFARLSFLSIITLLFYSCGSETATNRFTSKNNIVPDFNADSAYSFIEQQIKYGPRVPSTESHRLTRTFLVNTLKKYAGAKNVGLQKFSKVVYNDTLEMANIIAVINPTVTDRILLTAHWDSRPRSEEASTEDLMKKPVLGADDGASGVAVLLEIVRVCSLQKPEIGIDIVLFDGEDYGKPSDLSNYFLGSRYWADNQPSKNYKPRFGILLDMVGAKNATFLKEQFSLQKAPSLVDGIWRIAEEIGYQEYFRNKIGSQIADDHYILNRYLKFPTIDIINHELNNDGSLKFPAHWHSENDTIEIIDKKTLKATGQVLLELLFNRL